MSSNIKKVFNIGFHKTGTTSLSRFMGELGYKSLHSVAYSMQGLNLGSQIDNYEEDGKPADFDSLISSGAIEKLVDDFDYISDNPWPLLYKRLDRIFPNSLFILTTRNVDDWIKSLVKHSGDQGTKMRKLIYGYGSPGEHIKTYRKTFIRHNKDVQKYFKNKDNLLVIDIGEDDDVLAGKILKFTGMGDATIKFPTFNKQRIK